MNGVFCDLIRLLAMAMKRYYFLTSSFNFPLVIQPIWRISLITTAQNMCLHCSFSEELLV